MWDLLGKFAHQGVGFIISIFLARLLLPEEFGIVAIALVFIGFSQVFLHLGLSDALIQSPKVSKAAYSTVFYINLIMGVVLTAILFFSAPFIGAFYESEILIPIAQFLSLNFIIGSFSIVQGVILMKEMNFKKLSIITVVSSAVGGIIGIWMAFNEFGVWSLVCQNLITNVVNGIMHWSLSSWRPKAVFMLKEIEGLWGFGMIQFANHLMGAIYDKLDVFMIGKVFSLHILGLYNRGGAISNLILQYFSTSIHKVFYVAISKVQNNLNSVFTYYKKGLSLVTLGALGLSGGIFVISEDLIVLLFSEKWIESAYYFRLIIIGNCLTPLILVAICVVIGLGHAGLSFKIETFMRLGGIIPLVIGYFYGITSFLLARAFHAAIRLTVYMYYAGSLVQTPIIQQGKWIIKSIFISLAATSFCLLIDQLLMINLSYWYLRTLHMMLLGITYLSLFLFLTYVFNQQDSKLVFEKVRYLIATRGSANS